LHPCHRAEIDRRVSITAFGDCRCAAGVTLKRDDG
jgi:hypothetical protein